MWFRCDYGYIATDENNREYHAGRHCFIERDSKEQAEKDAMEYFKFRHLKRLSLNSVEPIDYIPQMGIIP